jgi:hypothetical protein
MSYVQFDMLHGFYPIDVLFFVADQSVPATVIIKLSTNTSPRARPVPKTRDSETSPKAKLLPFIHLPQLSYARFLGAAKHVIFIGSPSWLIMGSMRGTGETQALLWQRAAAE